MYDIAFALESYTIPEYEIATEGLVSGAIKVLLVFLKSFKGKLLAIVSAIVAILVASKRKSGSNDDSISEDEFEENSPKKSTGYNYTRRPNATIVRNNSQEPQQEDPSSVNSRYKRGPEGKTVKQASYKKNQSRDEMRKSNEAAKKARELQYTINRILSNINRGVTATKASLDLLVKYRGKHATTENTDSLIDYGGEIAVANQNIEREYQSYNDSYYAGIKISIDGSIYKNLASQKRSMETMIKMLDGLVKRYTNDKSFQQSNEPNDVKNFINDIPKKAAKLVAHITKTLTVIKTHS